LNSEITTAPALALDDASSSIGFRSALVCLFLFSGCAALIYEVVWYQLLQLVIGSTSVSLGILLAAFMGGLCLGSLGAPRIGHHIHPLRIYAGLELGIGLFAILLQLALPFLNRAYIAGAEHGLSGMLLRGTLAGLCLLPPTILMGASFPILVRSLRDARGEVSTAWWGYLYAGNTAGAVLGCLAAGFYLLRVYNMATATWVAVSLNVIVAAASWTLALSGRAATPVAGDREPAAAIRGHAWRIYLAIGLSGATALAAEVVWTRLLSMLLLGTVYVFAIILAVFLLGIALGSFAGSWLIKRWSAQNALGWCQILLTLGVAWAVFLIYHVLPGLHDEALITGNAWRIYALDLERCVLALLPSTILWGASFPFACAAIAAPGEDTGKIAGGVYAANTLGGILGALAMSLVLIPWIGSQESQRLLLLACAASGILVLAPSVRMTAKSIASVAAGLAVVGLLAWSIAPTPGELIAYGRRMALNQGASEILYTAEGRNSSVAISRWGNDAIYVNVNGHVEATTEIFDMKLQRMVGHLPALLHPNPRSVLGIGFGAGVSAVTFTRYPGIQHITVCEIEPVIPPASTRFFADQNYRVALDPRTKIVFDDARHYLMTATEKFDIIASDPLDVFVKGTAALYTREYFEAVKQHLNPGGYFSLYVPLYETDEPTIKSELATFFEAFPDGTVWGNTREGQGYDLVFLGQEGPLRIDLDDAQQRFDRPDYAPVRQSLADVGVGTLLSLLSTYTGNATDLKKWTKGSRINTDGDLQLSYLAGWGINANIEDYLFRRMLMFRTPPTDMLSGSPIRVHALLSMMESGEEEPN